MINKPLVGTFSTFLGRSDFLERLSMTIPLSMTFPKKNAIFLSHHLYWVRERATVKLLCFQCISGSGQVSHKMALDFDLPCPAYAQLRVDIYSFPLKSCVRNESVSGLL